MIKQIFLSALILAGIAALFEGLDGAFDSTAMVIFSLIALVLFYAFALWTVITNTSESQPLGLDDNES